MTYVNYVNIKTLVVETLVNLFGLRNTKLVHQTPQILLKSGFFQRNSGNLLNLGNIN